jgi:hypothetical protein
MIHRPDLFPEEKVLSYSKYYYIDPDPIHPLAAQLLRKPIDETDVLWPEQVKEMFHPGYRDAMLGYYIFDGGSYSSLYVQLHDVTIDMLDWWFVWMCLPPKSVPREHGNLRYKIWCPMDHYDHYPEDEWSTKRLTDESMPLRIRRQGIYDVSIESIDLGKSGIHKELHQHILPNTDLNLPQECWDYINACGTFSVFKSDHSVSLQFYRKTSFGTEAIIRTWRGYTLESGNFVRVSNYATPTQEHIVQDMYHSISEISHLEKILPSLFAEENNKPVDVY